MDSTEDEKNTQRNSPILIGQLGGLAAGIVVALIFGTDGGKTAISGMVLGAAAQFLFHIRYSLWSRLGVSLISIMAVAFAWWWE
ncbi:MAG: hypothetical protein K0U72_03150 [Gammaproteobacteria bacterium]|nr:hypothetical protein [Gammaproteobacteria bacterium]